VTVLLAATAAALFSIGTYLVLQRKLSRIIIGIALLSHGANVLMVSSGRSGRAPIIGNGRADELADPLPQALALTSIVISFGVTALLLALAYRSWLLSSDDEVQDDVEDDMIARRGAPDDELAGAGDPSEPDEVVDDEAVEDAPVADEAVDDTPVDSDPVAGGAGP
jgi:multicomponent Na+:H+ antiporter subunit C